MPVAPANKPECDPRVVHVVDGERPDDIDLLADGQLARDDVLRDLVGDHGRARDETEREPLRAVG